MPKAIIVESGYITPRDIARTLPASAFAESKPGVFLARLPLVVRHGATLQIGQGVKEFRMSQDRGAFLANAGLLVINNTHVSAWNEATNAPALWKEKHEFRPYIVSWGGSEIYILDSVVESLGYAASKAYGVSLSQYGEGIMPVKPARPTGWILHSEFKDMWYGFYCYEADDVVIKDNVYRDNIKYGIDPHDRSARLIIAGNEAYGTKEKHGIIISREVHDSWIIDNSSHNNTLSGIVLDRQSHNNVIAHNKINRNLANGITVYESPHNLIWQNLSIANDHHGIYLRNSTDIQLYENSAVSNGLSGIFGYIRDLKDIPRDLKRDPYTQKLSLVVVGGQLTSNGSGPISIDRPLRLELYDVDLMTPIRPLGMKMLGVLQPYQEQILDALVKKQDAVVLLPLSPQALTRR